VWGRETSLLHTFEGALSYKRRLVQLSRMKAKKGHDCSLQNSGEKWDKEVKPNRVKRPIYAK